MNDMHPVKRTMKKQKEFLDYCLPKSVGSNLLCGHDEPFMEFHRRHDRQTALQASVVVKVDVFCNGLYELIPTRKFVSIAHLAFQDSPKAFHWPVINTVCRSGHAFLHT